MNSDQAEILVKVKAVMTDIELSERDKEYLDEVVERWHPVAFQEAYDMGGRRTGPSFDFESYLDKMFEKMLDERRRTRRTEVVDALVQLQGELVVVPADG